MCSPMAAAHGDKLSLQPRLADAQILPTSAGQGVLQESGLRPLKHPHKHGSPALPCLQSHLTHQDLSPEETSAQKQTGSSSDLHSNPSPAPARRAPAPSRIFFQSWQDGSTHGSTGPRGPAVPCSRCKSPSSRAVPTFCCTGAWGGRAPPSRLGGLVGLVGLAVLRGPSVPPSLPVQTSLYLTDLRFRETARLLLGQRGRKSPSDPFACSASSSRPFPSPQCPCPQPHVPPGAMLGAAIPKSDPS